MRAEDVFELTGVSDPRVRPGGKEVAYVVWSIDGDENEYRQSIWLAPLDGSGPPRRLTSGDNDAQPRWSPDGERLAFVSKRGDEKAKRQLFVMPMGGGEPQRLTEIKDDVGRAGVVAGRYAARLLGARARRGVRGGGRQEARAAPLHPPALQARLRRLDR